MRSDSRTNVIRGPWPAPQSMRFQGKPPQSPPGPQPPSRPVGHSSLSSWVKQTWTRLTQRGGRAFNEIRFQWGIRQITQRLGQPDAAARQEAVHRLARLPRQTGAQARFVEKNLATLLNDADLGVRQAVWQVSPDCCQPSFLADTLFDKASAPSPLSRKEVAQAYTAWRHALSTEALKPTVLQSLNTLAQDANQDVRGTMVGTVAHLPLSLPEKRVLLDKIWDGSNPAVKLQIVELTATFPASPESEVMMRRHALNLNPEIRRKAAEMIFKMPEGADRAALLPLVLRDPDPRVVALAKGEQPE